MPDHDPLCLMAAYESFTDAYEDGARCICKRLEDARADERERHGNNCRGMWDEWLHDLRAQVEALDWWCERDTEPVLSRDAVLALIEEAERA